MIYTGCHGRDYPDGFQRVSISRTDPPGRRVDSKLWNLVPERNAANLIQPVFDVHYTKVLTWAYNDGVFERLIARGATEDVVLLCWEDSPEKGHRGKVAAFVKHMYNVVWPEHVGLDL